MRIVIAFRRARREWRDKRKLARLTGDERNRFLNLLWLEDEMTYFGPKDAPRVQKSALRRWFAR